MNSKMEKMSEDIVAIKVAQARTDGKIETLGVQINGLEEKFDQRFETVETKIGSLNDRIGQQEFTNRGIFVGLILVVLGGVAKLVFG